MIRLESVHVHVKEHFLISESVDDIILFRVLIVRLLVIVNIALFFRPGELKGVLGVRLIALTREIHVAMPQLLPLFIK